MSIHTYLHMYVCMYVLISALVVLVLIVYKTPCVFVLKTTNRMSKQAFDYHVPTLQDN